MDTDHLDMTPASREHRGIARGRRVEVQTDRARGRSTLAARFEAYYEGLLPCGEQHFFCLRGDDGRRFIVRASAVVLMTDIDVRPASAAGSSTTMRHRERRRQRVLDAITTAAMPGGSPLRSATAIFAITRGQKSTVLATIRELLAEGVIVRSATDGFRLRESRAS